jgi:hypothetical protein
MPVRQKITALTSTKTPRGRWREGGWSVDLPPFLVNKSARSSGCTIEILAGQLRMSHLAHVHSDESAHVQDGLMRDNDLRHRFC